MPTVIYLTWPWHVLRVDEALELVKELARSHRAMQAASLNSVARALAAHNVARALRMVSFMTTLGLPTYHQTTITLIGACARQHRAAEAEDLYWCARAFKLASRAFLPMLGCIQYVYDFAGIVLGIALCGSA